jgi:hypothetical protein
MRGLGSRLCPCERFQPPAGWLPWILRRGHAPTEGENRRAVRACPASVGARPASAALFQTWSHSSRVHTEAPPCGRDSHPIRSRPSAAGWQTSAHVRGHPKSFRDHPRTAGDFRRPADRSGPGPRASGANRKLPATDTKASGASSQPSAHCPRQAVTGRRRPCPVCGYPGAVCNLPGRFAIVRDAHALFRLTHATWLRPRLPPARARGSTGHRRRPDRAVACAPQRRASTSRDHPVLVSLPQSIAHPMDDRRGVRAMRSLRLASRTAALIAPEPP